MVETYLIVLVSLIGTTILVAGFTMIVWGDMEDWGDDVAPWIGVALLASILWPGILAVSGLVVTLAIPAGLMYCVWAALRKFWFERETV